MGCMAATVPCAPETSYERSLRCVGRILWPATAPTPPSPTARCRPDALPGPRVQSRPLPRPHIWRALAQSHLEHARCALRPLTLTLTLLRADAA